MAIGETILGAVLQVVFDRLASREIIDFFRSSKFDESLINKLKTLMLAAERLLLDAEEKQLIDRAVKQWLDELRHWFYRAEEVVNEIATEVLRVSIEKDFPSGSQSFGTKVCNFIPAFSKSSLFRNTCTLKIREIVEMLEAMLSQKDALGLREVSAGRPSLVQRMPSTYLLEDPRIYGRDEVKKNILEFLLSEKAKHRVSVMAVVGMGGVGKTTLAKHVFNDGKLKEAFEIKVWVCISDQFDISRVTRSILESITDQPYPPSLELNSLQSKLSSLLMEKRFLLVLDDVWNEKYEDWECLRAPLSVGAYGSKIIITTRNEEVASMMCTAPKFSLEPLSDADAWSLFSSHVFVVENTTPHSGLEDIGKKIVKRCQGLPLAIKTLGRLLRCTDEIREWEAISQSSLWDLPLEKSNVIPALWLSYYHLPLHLKRCFSYCALFPKDYKIERKQLVFLWMAENFVIPNKGREIEEVGFAYLRQLLSRSFLESVDESFVTMHDLMHDLAQLLFGEFLARRELESSEKFSERARHFSYVSDMQDGITKFQAIEEGKHLRTFLAVQSVVQYDDWKQTHYLTNRVTTAIVPFFSCLRVLSLSRYENLTLPESVGCLKQLCYLDISQSKLTKLPETVSTLYNLQTLLLSDCSCLERLPEELGNLKLLRHLDIRGTTSLLQMPKSMSKLKNLQTLTDFVVGSNGGSGLQVLAELQHIRCRFALRRLQNVTSPSDALYAALSSRTYIDELALEFDSKGNTDSQKAWELLRNLEPPRNLQVLTVKNYAGTRFPSWLDHDVAAYTNLTSLCISGCLYCLYLPPLGQLSSLKELFIEEMEYIVNIGPEFYGSNSSRLKGPFPRLEILRFGKMKSWRVWSAVDAKGRAVSFPYLKKLLLHDCPELKGKLPVHVPSLTEFEISECPQLDWLLSPESSSYRLQGRECLYAELTSAIDFTSITSLKLVGLSQLVSLPTGVEMLSSLSHLQIKKCGNLKSFATLQLSRTLEHISISFCDNLESLPKGMKFLTRLRNLSLVHCKSIKSTRGNNLPTSLSHLFVNMCEVWEFPITIDRMQHYTPLETLYFKNTTKHKMSFPLGVFPNLSYAHFENCEGLEKVYIPEGVDEKSLLSLTHLLTISCANLEMVGKEVGTRQVTVLPTPNLRKLCIEECEKVKPVLIEMEGKILLPRLTHLTMDKSHGIEVELALSLRKSLPALSYLTFLEIMNEELECFPSPHEGWVSLPASLKLLCINSCPKLRWLDGNALQTLACLKGLWIEDCPKLERLPEEGLPTSIVHVAIYKCPMLTERCQPEKGLDWSKIQHIPLVRVEDHCVTGPSRPN